MLILKWNITYIAPFCKHTAYEDKPDNTNQSKPCFYINMHSTDAHHMQYIQDRA